MIKAAFFRPSQGRGEIPLPKGLEEQVLAVNLPLHRIKPIPGSSRRLLEELRRGYEWLVFTSRNGVKALLADAKREKLTGQLLTVLSRVKIAAVGARTAGEAVRAGLKVHLVPEEHTGRALAEALLARGARSVLLARSKRGIRDIVDILERGGVRVCDLPVYELETHERRVEHVEVALSEFDVLVFTSPSTVEAFLEGLNVLGVSVDAVNSKTVISIGPTTSKALEKAGVKHLTARKYDMEGILEVLKSLL